MYKRQAGTVYDDAVKFILDEAGNSTGNHTWFFDQYGNLIGNVEIAAANSYGVINSIWWAGNTADGSGVAKANVTSIDSMMEAIRIELGEKKARFLEGNKKALLAGMEAAK